MSSKRNRKRSARLRKIVRLRDNFTCQSKNCSNPEPCPVQGRCYQTAPNDKHIINKCSHQIDELDSLTDQYQGYRKTECPLQVHHIIPFFKLKHRKLSLNEEAECCTLLCGSCHNNEHKNK